MDYVVPTLAVLAILLALASGWVLTLFCMPGTWLIVISTAVYAYFVPDSWRIHIGWGVAGAVLAVAMWVRSGDDPEGRICAPGDSCEAADRSLLRCVIDDTNFITAWVVLSFVGYELLVAALGIDLGDGLAVWAPLVPAMVR